MSRVTDDEWSVCCSWLVRLKGARWVNGTHGPDGVIKRTPGTYLLVRIIPGTGFDHIRRAARAARVLNVAPHTVLCTCTSLCCLWCRIVYTPRQHHAPVGTGHAIGQHHHPLRSEMFFGHYWFIDTAVFIFKRSLFRTLAVRDIYVCCLVNTIHTYRSCIHVYLQDTYDSVVPVRCCCTRMIAYWCTSSSTSRLLLMISVVQKYDPVRWSVAVAVRGFSSLFWHFGGLPFHVGILRCIFFAVHVVLINNNSLSGSSPEPKGNFW